MLDPLLLLGLKRGLFARCVDNPRKSFWSISTTIVYNLLTITEGQSVATGLCNATLVINIHTSSLRLFDTCQENGCFDGLEGPVVINIWSIEVVCEQGSRAGFGDR